MRDRNGSTRIRMNGDDSSTHFSISTNPCALVTVLTLFMEHSHQEKPSGLIRQIFVKLPLIVQNISHLMICLIISKRDCLMNCLSNFLKFCYSLMQNPRCILKIHFMRPCLYKQPLLVARARRSLVISGVNGNQLHSYAYFSS